MLPTITAKEIEKRKKEHRRLIEARAKLIGNSRRVIIIYTAKDYKMAMIFDLLKSDILEKELWLVHHRVNISTEFDAVTGMFRHNNTDLAFSQKTKTKNLIGNLQIAQRHPRFKIIKSIDHSNFYFNYLKKINKIERKKNEIICNNKDRTGK